MEAKTIWLDALTSKQARLVTSLARKLVTKGYKVLITVRSYEYTEKVARKFAPSQAEVRVAGGYGGSRFEKLVRDAERVKLLSKIVYEKAPCILISYPSPSAVRVAFGFSLPIVLLTDSPHAYHASRLTIPLADYVVFSSFIPRDRIEKYVLKEFTKLIAYRGFDELEYINDYLESKHSIKPKEALEELNLEPKNYVVVRPAEYKAAYYNWQPAALENLAVRLAKKNVKVVFFPRYPEQEEKVANEKNIIVPREAVDTLPLLEYAAAVVTGGATLAREAAFLGTPGITLFPQELEVNKAVAELGFPLIIFKKGVEELEETILRIIREGFTVDRGKLENLVKSLEKPSNIVLRLLDHHCR